MRGRELEGSSNSANGTRLLEMEEHFLLIAHPRQPRAPPSPPSSPFSLKTLQHTRPSKPRKLCPPCTPHTRRNLQKLQHMPSLLSSKTRVSHQRPDKVRFNQTLMLNLMYLEDSSGKNRPVLHILDSWTKFQAAAFTTECTPRRRVEDLLAHMGTHIYRFS